MGLNKYKGFIGGDPLPAENVNSIDPENVSSQTAGYLLGGTGHSPLSVFQALGIGANNGKFKINVDGDIYDNIGISFTLGTPSVAINQAAYTTEQSIANASWAGQSFTTPSDKNYISSIDIPIRHYNYPSGNFTVSLYLADGSGLPTGAPIKTYTVAASSVTYNNNMYGTYWTCTLNAIVLPSTKYVVVLSLPSTNWWIYFVTQNTDVLSGGNFMTSADSGLTWTQQATVDMKFRVNMVEFYSTFSSIAALIQSAIRAATGSTETVVYDTDHFKITSAIAGRSSQILKLMSPSTGTDISGAGAIPYLDCADNATEVLGTGDDYNLVRLDKDAKIPCELLDIKRSSGVVTKDLAEASSIQTIPHGMPQTPKKIKITAMLANSSSSTVQSSGVFENNKNKCVWVSVWSNAFYSGISTDVSIYLRTSNSSVAYAQSGVISVDSENIFIDWTKISSASGSALILWEAEL